MCDCNKTTNISMGCCQPVLGPIEAYYTKFTIDRKLEEITSAITSGCCITPEEVDEKITSAKTEIESEIPTVPTSNTAFTNDAGYITGVDLSNYATTGDVANVSTALTAHTSDTTIHVTPEQVASWNLKTNVWCGSEADWALISGGTLDPQCIYLVY